MHRIRVAWLGGVVLSVLAAACGGNVVVDHGGDGGASGAGGAGSGAGKPSGDLCQQAVNHVGSCIPTPSSSSSGMMGSCTGVAKCEAACIIETSCAGLEGSDLGAVKKLEQCVKACQIQH